MALPIAHAAAGYLIHRVDRRRSSFDGWQRALAFMAIANLPDADFLVGFVLGQPGTFHRGVSHTLLAALVFGVLAGAALARRTRERWWAAGAMLAAVYASHLLLDALTIDERGPAGAQFFWPLSDAYFIFPHTVFREIIIDGGSRGGFVASILRWPTVGVLAREAVLATVAIAAFNLIEAWLGARRARAPLAVTLVPESREEDLA